LTYKKKKNECAITVIGIANSIDLFRGEGATDVGNGLMFCQREERVLFSPYTR